MQTIVVKEVGQAAEAREVELSYEAMCKIVDGYLQMIYVNMDGHELTFWCNEEGKVHNLPVNFVFPASTGTLPGDTANGDVFVCDTDEEGESIGLSPEQVEAALAWFTAADPVNV